MKKFFILLSLLCCFFSIPLITNAAKLNIDVPKVTKHEKVKIYLFRGNGCIHCYDFLNYFNNHASQFSKYIEIVAFETKKDSKNYELKNKVNDFLEITNEKDRGSVPLIVIGSWHMLGFLDSDGETIIKEALKAYQDDNYVDEVQKIIAEENLTVNTETLKEACTKEGIKAKESNGLIIVVMFGVILAAFLVIGFSVKKK